MKAYYNVFCTGNYRYFAEGIVWIAVTSYIFYGNVLFGLVLSPYLIFYVKRRIQEQEKWDKERLAERFKNGMLAVSSALNAGYSIENSFREALGELKLLYGEKSDIVEEFYRIVRKININRNVEDALDEFANSSGLEDAKYLAEIFRYAKRSGGDMINIIKKTAKTISDKGDVKREIATTISGKRMEQKIMSMVPYIIIIYLKVTAPEFVSPLYEDFAGRVVMTICLIVYIAAKYMAEKIVNIEI